MRMNTRFYFAILNNFMRYQFQSIFYFDSNVCLNIFISFRYLVIGC